MHLMILRRVAALVSGAALLAIPAASVNAADPVEVLFAYTGAEQQFVVPDGVTSIHVVLVGGRGGSYADVVIGGRGGRVEGDLPVVAGATLYVEVGFRGADVRLEPNPGGFNGGGAGGTCGPDVPGTFRGASGGGASDIRTIPTGQAGSLDSRLVVAGGGGGAGDIGNGGDAGAPGAGTWAGGAGTSTGGGPGGTADVPGNAGSLGVGGAGASSVACGAGGGGGYYGGGGGGASSSDSTDGGAGGGGSNLVGQLANAQTAYGSPTADAGAVVISYEPSAGTGTVSAQVTVPTSAACLQLSTAAVDFGTLGLGAEDQPGAPDVTVTSCSGVSETVFARGTDATGTAASWALVDSTDTCGGVPALAVDTYRLDLLNGATRVGLATTNKSLGALAPGADQTHTPRIFTACPGSTGGGLTMTMQIVFVATE